MLIIALIIITVLIIINLIKHGSNNITFMVRSEYYDEKKVNKLFSKYFTKTNKNPDILYQDGCKSWEKNRYKSTKKQLVTNNLTIKNLTMKDNLYDTLTDAYEEELMPKQYNVKSNQPSSDFEHLFEGSMFIVKPVGSGFFSGKGIFMASDYSTFAKNRILDKPYVISTYIMSPMLIEEKKFHIRYYCLVGQDRYHIKLPKMSYIQLAREKYKSSDWDNTDIHDTHWIDKEHSRSLKTLEEFPNGSDLLSQIDQLIEKTVNVTEMVSYGDTKYAYTALGYDFMISNDKVYIIEINEKVGLKGSPMNYFIKANIDMIKHGLSN